MVHALNAILSALILTYGTYPLQYDIKRMNLKLNLTYASDNH
jgi:hypothetical protein